MERLIRCRSESTESTDPDDLALLDDVFDVRDPFVRELGMCTSSSTPGASSTKAPKSVVLVTVPVISASASMSRRSWSSAPRTRLRPRAIFGGEVLIDLEHLDLDLVTDLEDLVRMLDPFVGDRRDMDEAIDAAKICKCAVSPDGRYGCGHDLADLQGLQERFPVGPCSAARTAFWTVPRRFLFFLSSMTLQANFSPISTEMSEGGGYRPGRQA